MKQWPRLLVKQLSGSQDFSAIKFQKIEFYNKQPPENKVVVLKSLHKQTETIHSFRLSTEIDNNTRQRRKSESGGLTSSKISNIDLKYPKTLIQQHQFIDRVKDLRRRAIQGRMKSKFQKSYKKIDGGKPSNFNPQVSQTNREKALASLQEIQVTRTFQRDRTYYQRTFEKMNSGLTPDSPSEHSIQFQKSQKKIIIRPKWQQFVLLQINRYKPKSFEQLKRDSIINLLSDTKETMPNTPAVKVRIQHKLQPYFCIPRKKGSQKTCLTSQSQRLQTVL